MTRLSFDAREQLKAAGISQAAWACEHFADGTWSGDKCGCPDDRCIGYHHDAEDDCGCLPAFIELWQLPVPSSEQSLTSPRRIKGASGVASDRASSTLDTPDLS